MTRRFVRSPKATDAFKTFVLDQLEELGDVTARSMFGGFGLYCRGLFFGIIARGDVLYFKVDQDNRGDYERVGMRPFRPYVDRPLTMRYYAVPVEVIESAFELAAWGRKAVAAAARAATRDVPARRADERRRAARPRRR